MKTSNYLRGLSALALSCALLSCGGPKGPTPPPKVPPRTTLIREGLDASPALSYFVHEEEVPRAGILVTESFRRTRWHGGQATVWLGIRKQTGRGERGSGLAFDTIETPRQS